jgi:MFS family permease
MSNRSHVPAPEMYQSKGMSRFLIALITVGIISLVVALAIGIFSPGGSQERHQFVFSWLFAFIYFFTILIGCLFWILLHHSTDSGWGIVVRRQMENLAALIPWMLIFFIPILLFRTDLWTWITAIKQPQMDPDLKAKLSYFALPFGPIPFFWVRAILYFVLFGAGALYFKKTSVKQDQSGDPRLSRQMRGVSFPGLILFGAGLTGIAFDWLAALDYRWASTMWGVYIFAGSAGASMALIILVVFGLQNAGYLSFINEEHYHIMGKLLFTFSIFWGYIGFSQYMLIWYGNIPEETEWFLHRNVESWNTLSTAMVVGRFFIPFLYLLFQYTKRNAKFLAFISVWVLCMHLLDTYITILPILHPAGFQIDILDVLSVFAIGCPLAFIFFRTLGKVSLFPSKDPRLLESLKLSN